MLIKRISREVTPITRGELHDTVVSSDLARDSATAMPPLTFHPRLIITFSYQKFHCSFDFKDYHTTVITTRIFSSDDQQATAM